MHKVKEIYSGVVAFFYPGKPFDSEEEKDQLRFFINCCFLAAVIFLGYYFSVKQLQFSEGMYTVVLGPILCGIVLFVLKAGVPFSICANLFVLVIYSANLYGIYYSGGLYSGTMASIIEFPMLALLIIGRNSSIGWFIISFATIFFYAFYCPNGAGVHYNLDYDNQFFITGHLGALLAVFIVVLFFYNRREKSQALLKVKNDELIEEKEKSEKLLLNILPQEVVEELKVKGIAAAKHFDNTTVFFSDFVSFTEFSERLSPQELVDELHNCFKAFDEIFTKYGIEKIKTVGDTYLAIAGLPSADERHARHILNAAIEIRNFMLRRRKELGEKTFEMRIGIHSGSVVAGIVGVRKFAYDIWGDNVNIAARMEQSCEAGKINISETTYALVKDVFTFEYRGEILAKRKGKLKMYFLNNTVPENESDVNGKG